MAALDFAHYKRVIERFLDREPVNDDPSGADLWCLGQRYSAIPSPDRSSNKDSESKASEVTEQQPQHQGSTSSTVLSPPSSELETTEASSRTSFDDELAYGKAAGQQGLNSTAWPRPLLDDFESRIWLTYRSGFLPISRVPDGEGDSQLSFSVRLRLHFSENKGFSSDTGWGCMIRSGQSLLANALLIQRHGRKWRRNERNEEEPILRLFADEPSAPFSIHKFVGFGASNCGKTPGEWFGPSATARCIGSLAESCKELGLRIWVSQDSGEVDIEDLTRKAHGADGTFHPTLVLLSTRLGIDRITPVYWEGLKVALQLSQAVGIAGGRPSASHYFVGMQASWLLYLDPHHTRPAMIVDPSKGRLPDEAIVSCHTRRLRRLSIEEMDPSMLIGFLLRDKDDFDDWRSAMSRVPGRTIVHFNPPGHPESEVIGERSEAIDEVESIDDDDDDEQEQEQEPEPRK